MSVMIPLKNPSRDDVDPEPGTVPDAVWVTPNPTDIPAVLPTDKT